jgi:translocation and assembly module TamA
MRGFLPVAAFILVAPCAVLAQEEEAAGPIAPYEAEVRPTGDSALDRLLAAQSLLISQQSRAPTDADGVRSRMDAEPARLRPLLDAEGFYAAQVQVVPEGEPRNGAEQPLKIEIRVETGPRYTLRHVETRGGPTVPLEPGGPARAEVVLAAQATALTAMRAAGRPLARLDREVTVDHDARAMDVLFVSTPGAIANFAPAVVEGTVRVDPEVVRRVADARLAGRLYSPARAVGARADVMALGPFGSARIQEGEALDAEGRLPVTVRVQERPFRALSASVAYETNYGASLRGAWEHRNLFGGAENFRVEAEVSRLGNEFDRTNGRLSFIYRNPLPLGYDGSLLTNLSFLRERLDSYDRDAMTLSVLYERRLTDRWTVNAGPVVDVGRTGPSGLRMVGYQIAGFQMQARYDSTDSALDPRRGWRLDGRLTPSYAFVQATPYLQLRASASTYIDLSGNGRSILAMRAALGSLLNARAGDVPFNQRFYAGGGGSVRGYSYQSIGPRDALNKPAGGASLLEASIEFRQRFLESFGAVVFVDAGAVGERSFAPTDEIRVGAGVGVRYYTAIGPVRADVAMPLIRQQGSSGFGVYLGLGHSF